MKFFCILTFILIVKTVCSEAKARWSYKGKHGIYDWAGSCASGRRQSPIDIASRLIEGVTKMDEIVFKYYDVPPAVEKIANNGHSVTFTIEPVAAVLQPRIHGGGLPGEYMFSQLHFHWGSKDVQGAEHTINGYRAPMEMHLVHFNTKYGNTIAEALTNSQGASDTLAVLAVMFQISEEDNHNFDYIVEELEFVKFAEQEISNVTVFPLEKVLPPNKNVFYRYNGSLTTPPCLEIVIWTIFKEPVSISEEQLEKFRQIVDVREDSEEHESESDNFRALQPLNERLLLEVYTGAANTASVFTALRFFCHTVLLFFHKI